MTKLVGGVRDLLKTTTWAVCALCLGVLVTALLHGAQGIAASPQEIHPLLTGSKIPNVVFTKIDGSALDLMTAVSQKPTILILYRGGW